MHGMELFGRSRKKRQCLSPALAEVSSPSLRLALSSSLPFPARGGGGYVPALISLAGENPH